MGGIKYYQLAKGEELPDEFCAVRDVNGEPSEYTWYERMSEFDRELWVLFTQSNWFAGSEYRKLQADNAKLRELVRDMWKTMRIRDEEYGFDVLACESFAFSGRMRDLGVEVDA